MDGCVYIATSRDGMIARSDGSFDWLDGPDVAAADTEAGGDMGFGGFIDSVGALVMGRNTFDSVPLDGLDASPYGDTPIFVLTSRPLVVPDVFAGLATPMEGKPHEIAGRLDERGIHRAYIDGGVTIQSFLVAGLITEMTLTVLPVLIGDGIPLFGSIPADIHLRLRGSETFANGLLQSIYDVVR